MAPGLSQDRVSVFLQNAKLVTSSSSSPTPRVDYFPLVSTRSSKSLAFGDIRRRTKRKKDLMGRRGSLLWKCLVGLPEIVSISL